MIGFLTGRFGLAAIALTAALTWHYVDKAAAVRSAEQALADKVEIETLKAQVEAAVRRAGIAQEANVQLREQIEQHRQDAEAAEMELKDYAETVSLDPVCVVGADLIERLRNR